MIIYLTYNDPPSGVYWSQVTDVVAHLNTLGGPPVRLVALVSLRDYFGIRGKIRAHSPEALVLPMVPGVKRWRLNRFIVHALCRLLHPSALLARGALATWMALYARGKGAVGKVCFDARGAYAAEWEEYRIIDDDALIAQVRPVEEEAVTGADMRLAVSHGLVQHWSERYGYAGTAYVVVPCTLGRSHLVETTDPEARRKALGFGPEDVVLAYAGSTAGWQSFHLLSGLLRHALMEQPALKVLFLSPPDQGIDMLAQTFPGRVVRAWVPAAEVPQVLHGCDAALLVREDSITNRVASPTKFAEYLACDLPVVISEHIGDYSALVREHKLGVVLREGEGLPAMHHPLAEDRERCRAFALAHFTKQAHTDSYRRLLHALD